MSKLYHHRPAGPARPQPEPPVKSYPEGYWKGEEKFHVWRFDRPDSFNRTPGVIREYEVFGLVGWNSGPRASQLNMSRTWTLRLRLVDDKLLAEGEVLIYPSTAKLVGVEEPERGVVVTFPISTPDEDTELREMRRYVLRLASWAGERLSGAFEVYLGDQGL
jgi:hypothetical protein